MFPYNVLTDQFSILRKLVKEKMHNRKMTDDLKTIPNIAGLQKVMGHEKI